MRAREGPVQMRRCGSLQIEKEIRERLWSRKKKASRLLMSQMPGRTSLWCRELVFSGYQFLLGDVAGGRTVVQTPLVLERCVTKMNSMLSGTPER